VGVTLGFGKVPEGIVVAFAFRVSFIMNIPDVSAFGGITVTVHYLHQRCEID